MTLFLCCRVGVDPDQDQQPCGDSFQVLQGVRIPLRLTLTPITFTGSAALTVQTAQLLQFYVDLQQSQHI